MSPVNILGIATAFGEHLTMPEGLDEIAAKWATPNEALTKTLFVNKNTKIKHRPHVQLQSAPVLNGPKPPTIKAVNTVFLDKGVKMAVKAAEKAIRDWGGKKEDITHLIANTCTASSFPGFDYNVLVDLGLPMDTDRTLLHGVGCAGGMSALRLANQLARIPPPPGSKPPRILVVAAEVVSTLARSEIDQLSRSEDGRANVSLCLFSDGASAMIVSGGDLASEEKSSFEIVHAFSETIPDTPGDLGFQVDEHGWKAVISSQVPKLTSVAVPPAFKKILSAPWLANDKTALSILSADDPSSTPASQFDWMIHPGGSLIISKIEASLGISAKDHSRASWEVYTNKGNSSSVGIGAVMEASREMQDRNGCVAVGFGPGVTLEISLLKRTGWKGRLTEENGKVGYPNGQANGITNGHTNSHTSSITNGVNGLTVNGH